MPNTPARTNAGVSDNVPKTLREGKTMAVAVKDQKDAFRDFVNALDWKPQKGRITRTLADGTLIDIMEVVGGHWQPIVTTPWEPPQYCYSVNGLEEAMREAWTCYQHLSQTREPMREVPPEAQHE
jgi:hypothetical protein